MNARDELAELLAKTDGQVPEGLSDKFYGRAAEAILAAGYSKLRQVSTMEELDALPVGSVILRNGRAFTRFAPRSGPFGEYHMWQCPDGGFVRSTKDGSTILPATVLYTPDAPTETGTQA